MKNIFTLLLLTIIGTYTLSAQLLQEDFNSCYNWGPFPPDNWSVEENGVITDNSATYPDLPTHWYGSTDEVQAGGEICEIVLNNYPYTELGLYRLISPVIDASGNSSLNLSFKHKFAADPYEGYSCAIGLATTSDGGATWNEVWNSGTIVNHIGPELKSITIENSDVNSANFQFCLFFTGDFYNMSDWRIDDVLLEAPVQKDILVSAILGDSQFASNDIYIPEATVQNMGTLAQTFDIICKITDFESGIEVYSNTVNITMVVGEELNLSFPSFTIPENGRVYNVEVESLLADDDILDNNKANKEINSWTVQKQNILLEVSSYITCAACPTAALGATTINEDYNVSVIEHHTSSDPQPYQYSTADGRARLSYFGSSGAPSAWFDIYLTKSGGCPSMNCIDEYLPIYNEAMSVKTPILINIVVNETATPNIYDVIVIVNKEEVVYVDNLILMLTLTESHVPENWTVSEPMLTELDFINRVMYPDVNGTTIDLVNNNQIVQHYTVDASAYNYTMELVAWVEDHENKYVYQTQEFYLEDAIPLNICQLKENQISIFPNPCSDVLNIKINSTNINNTSYQIKNILGVVQYTGKLNSVNNLIDISKLTNGNYILTYNQQVLKFVVNK